MRVHIIQTNNYTNNNQVFHQEPIDFFEIKQFKHNSKEKSGKTLRAMYST